MFSRTHFMGQRPWTRPLLGQTEGLPPQCPQGQMARIKRWEGTTPVWECGPMEPGEAVAPAAGETAGTAPPPQEPVPPAGGAPATPAPGQPRDVLACPLGGGRFTLLDYVTGELVEQNAGQEAWSKYSVTSLPEEWACQDSRCAPYCGAAGAPPAAPAPAPGAGPAPMPTVPLPTQPPVGQTPGTRPLNVTIQLRRFPVVVLRPMTFGPRPLQPKSAAPPAAR